MNEKCCILIKIPLKLVPKGPINNTAALVQRMAWCVPCDRPLSEPMMVSLPTHICATRHQWVKAGVKLFLKRPVVMIFVTIIGIFMSILYFLNYNYRLWVTKKFWFCKCVTTWMFQPLDILLEYWIEHVTFGRLNVMFTFPTRIFYRGVPGFATVCPCGVWCRGLTTCLLYVGAFLEI